jgi:hypothetical protein
MDVIQANQQESPMVLRSTLLALAAIATLLTTVLTPVSASAGGIRNGGHGIIVVCRKGR